MSELPAGSPNTEPVPSMGELVETVLDNPRTRSYYHDDRSFLGTGTETTTQSLGLEGWGDLVEAQYRPVGSLVLHHQRTVHHKRRIVQETADVYKLSFTYTTDDEGRGSATLFERDVDVNKSAEEDDGVSSFLQSHLKSVNARKEEYERRKLPPMEYDFSQPYELTYPVDEIQLMPDMYLNPRVAVQQEINRLYYHSQYYADGNENPEYDAAVILKTFQEITHDTLEDYHLNGEPFTREVLDTLVRENFTQAARDMMQRAQQDAYRSGVGVYNFKEMVDTLLWKAANEPTDIGTTPETIAQLDTDINMARAQTVVAALRGVKLTAPTPLDVRIQQEKIDMRKAQLQEMCTHLGVSVEDLGIPQAEYDHMQATYSPTGLRGIAEAFKRRR